MNRTAWILVGLFVVLVVVLIFVLGDQDDGATTTSLGATTTISEETTTTPGGTTTTAQDGATTTVAGTTTTSLGTTTTAGLEGNWADEPVVVAGFGALGWWDGTAWAQVEAETELPLSGNESYQVAVLGLQAITTGGSPTTLCDPLDNPGVELENEQLLGDFPGPYGVAISASWPLVPHLVETLEDDGTNSGFAAELLAERGLEVPQPVIKQLLRVDLEGDGVNEVIVVAEDVTEGLFAEEGDYSIAFMRRTVDGDIRTLILGESVIVTADDPLVYAFSVGAVADLNGDGKMEIVLSSAYYEGLGVEVWEYVDDDQGLVSRITQGCGA
ncbi:MAG: hypothetical protein ACRDZM_04370 [Acidimicrobiia bacterium]